MSGIVDVQDTLEVLRALRKRERGQLALKATPSYVDEVECDAETSSAPFICLSPELDSTHPSWKPPDRP
jgi:hypothetical protein